MVRSKRWGLLIILGGLLLGGATVWVWWPRPLSPAEAAVVGTWFTPTQPDSSSTTLLLRPNRICQVRWLGAAGNEQPAQPPRDGHWRVEGETLIVTTYRESGLLWSLARVLARALGGKPSEQVWDFAVADGGLV